MAGIVPHYYAPSGSGTASLYLGLGVQFHEQFCVAPEEREITPEIAEEAAILTGIGMGTAFGLLLLLVAVTVVVRIVSEYISKRGAGDAVSAEADARERALAAVVGVTAFLAQGDRGDRPQPDGS